MSKKLITGIMLVLLFAGVGNLIAQETTDRGRGQRRTPVEGDRANRPGFGSWLDEISKAYEQNDREKMGQLIEDMKTRRQGRREPGQGRGRQREGRPADRKATRRRSDRADAAVPAKSSPTAQAQAEKHILSVLEDLHENQRRGMMNVPPEDGRLLRLLTEAVGAKRVIEIGTSNGYSGIWFCLALRKTGGKLITHEIDADRAALAHKNFKRAGVNEIVTLVEGDAHKEVTKLKGPIDILFLDADKEGYIDYFNKLLPMVRPGGLILAHNTSNVRAGMDDYLEAVTTNPDLETIFLHEQEQGMGVTLKKR